MQRRELRLPFVVTIATASVACGGLAVVEADATGGGGSPSGAGPGATTGSSSATGSTATGGPASSSATGTTIDCPPAAPSGYDACEPSAGACTYQVACQSGVVSLSFICGSGWWELEPSPCAQPYDSCPGTDYYCDVGWWMPTGTNPPSPCPQAAPPAGEACTPGGMGGVWEQCGYLCSPGGDWTVATCTAAAGPGYWTYDGACGG